MSTRTKKAAIGLILAVAASGFLPAHAEVDCTVAGASEATPHAIDELGDYDGVVTGNESGIIPLIDAYGEGVDLARGWLERDEEGNYRAHIRVANLAGIETNAMYYFNWTFVGDSPEKKKRFVSAQTRPWGDDFSWGYIDESGPINTIEDEGSTTGTVVTGPNGGFIIDVPMDQMGDPQPGDELSEISIEASVLVGSPGHGQTIVLPLPEVTAPLPEVELGQFGTIGGDTTVGGDTRVPGSGGSGFVFAADDSSNAPELCQTITI